MDPNLIKIPNIKIFSSEDNFGKNQVSIIMKKNHPLYDNVNGELIKMREKGELFTISKKWLSYGQSMQLEI